MNLIHNYIRSVIVVFIFIILYTAIAFNLYVIQIKQTSFFKQLGDRQYNVTIQTYPERGTIYDRNNIPVAVNKDCYSAFILPKLITNKENLILCLQQNFPQSVDRLEHNKNKNFMFVKRNLSDQEINLIEQQNIPDIHLLKESSRFYPFHSLGTIIGITDVENNGLFGIEQQFNTQLAGSATTYTLKKDAKIRHFYFAQETTQQGVDAESINLTIDADLQFKFQNILDETVKQCEAKEAGALALDPETGEILAMVSYPYFDPNNTKELDLQNTKNRPVTECFETGSVIKVFATLAALEEEVVTIDEIIDCESTKETKLDNIRIRTVVPHGKIPFIDVIKFSNNIGIVKIMKRVGSDLYDYYKLLGFGELTGINLTGEQKGFVNHPSNWSAYSIQSLSYGYEITTSLLHLARAFALIMNGGYLVTPTIIKTNFFKKHGPLISQHTLNDLQKILEETVESGTGRRAKIAGYKVLGKTGTSNLLQQGTYDDRKHLYTFVGAIQSGEYKRIIVAYVKESKAVTYSSLVAAPLFKKLAETMLLHEQIF